MSNHTARFALNEARARAFLHRALRRYAGDLADGEGAGAGAEESWTLAPGWDPAESASDEATHLEDLVYEAVYEARAIILPAEQVDIELLLETPFGGDWMYQWRVSFPPVATFALCSPYREEFGHLGWNDGTVGAKGCRAALSILREAVATGNELLGAYTDAQGRIPTISS